MAEAESPTGVAASQADEAGLLAALRSGDEKAFAALVDTHHAAMIRLAMVYVPSRAVAEEVAQEAWLGVLQGLDRFEGRSSLKTWIFRILMNRAMSRGQRERRSVPFSALFESSREPGQPAVDPDRFMGPEAESPGHWARPPRRWEGAPEERLVGHETINRVAQAIKELSPSQREVITLRDVEGWTSREVCNVLGITETNQRVLLHRARSRFDGPWSSIWMRMLDRIRRRRRPGASARSLQCTEVVEIITEYLEGTLPRRDRARFEAHLEGCEGCRNYLDQMRKTIRLVGHIREDAIPPRMKEVLIQAFRSRTQRHDTR